VYNTITENNTINTRVRLISLSTFELAGTEGNVKALIFVSSSSVYVRVVAPNTSIELGDLTLDFGSQVISSVQGGSARFVSPLA
jgi:hypothetical protein